MMSLSGSYPCFVQAGASVAPTVVQPCNAPICCCDPECMQIRFTTSQPAPYAFGSLTPRPVANIMLLQMLLFNRTLAVAQMVDRRPDQVAAYATPAAVPASGPVRVAWACQVRPQLRASSQIACSAQISRLKPRSCCRHKREGAPTSGLCVKFKAGSAVLRVRFVMQTATSNQIAQSESL